MNGLKILEGTYISNISSSVKRNEIPWPEKSTHIYGLQVLYRGISNTKPFKKSIKSIFYLNQGHIL